MPEKRDRRVSSLLTGVTISPKEVPVEGGEKIIVTFPQNEKVPEAAIFLVFTGNSQGHPNIVRTDKINEHTVSAIAPCQPSEGPVKVEVLYRLKRTTFVLYRDRINFTSSCSKVEATTESHEKREPVKMGGNLSTKTASPNGTDIPDSEDGRSLLLEKLKSRLMVDSVKPFSQEYLTSLRDSLCKLRQKDLSHVDTEIGEILEREVFPSHMEMDAEGKSEITDTTFFHLMAEYGMVNITRRLVKIPEACLAVIRLDNRGQLPEEVAIQYDQKDIAKLFIKCRQQLPFHRHDDKRDSLHSLDSDSAEGDWSTLTVKRKKGSDNVTRYRVANLKVKLSVERNEFSSMTGSDDQQDSDDLEVGNPALPRVRDSVPSDNSLLQVDNGRLQSLSSGPQSKDDVIQSSDEVAPQSSDDVVQSNDEVAPQSSDDVVQSSDEIAPQSKDDVVQSSDEVAPQSKDDMIQYSDEVAPQSKDEVVQSSDEVAPQSKDEVVQSSDEVAPQSKDEVVQSSDEVAPQSKDEVIQTSDEAALQSKDEAAPQSNDEAAPKSKDEAAPQSNDEAAPQSKDEAAPQSKDEAAPQSNDEAAPQSKDDVVESSDEVAPQSKDEVIQTSDEAAPQSKDEAAPQSNDEAAPKSKDEAAPQSNDEAAPQSKDEAAPQSKDEAAPQSNDEAAPQSKDDVVESSDEVAPQSSDDVVQSCDEAAPQSKDEVVQSSDEVAPQSKNEVVQSSDEVAPQSKDEAAPQSKDEAAPQSKDDVVESSDEVAPQSSDDVVQSSDEAAPQSKDEVVQSSDEVAPHSKNDVVQSSDEVAPQSKDEVVQSSDEIAPQSKDEVVQSSDEAAPQSKDEVVQSSDEVAPHSKNDVVQSSDEVAPQSKDEVVQSSDEIAPQSKDEVVQSSDEAAPQSSDDAVESSDEAAPQSKDDVVESSDEVAPQSTDTIVQSSDEADIGSGDCLMRSTSKSSKQPERAVFTPEVDFCNETELVLPYAGEENTEKVVSGLVEPSCTPNCLDEEESLEPIAEDLQKPGTSCINPLKSEVIVEFESNVTSTANQARVDHEDKNDDGRNHLESISDTNLDSNGLQVSNLTHSAPDLLSDTDKNATPTPEFIPVSTGIRPKSSHLRRDSPSSFAERVRRSRSLDTVDRDLISDNDEDPTEHAFTESPQSSQVFLGNYRVSVTSGSYSSSSDGESNNGESNQEFDTDEFASAKEEWSRSPGVSKHRKRRKHSAPIIQDRPTKAVQDKNSISASNNLLGKAVIDDSGSSDLAASVGSLASDEKQDINQTLQVPNMPHMPRAISTESEINGSDLNLSDVDVSVNGLDTFCDNMLSRDRGKSDPLPYSIAVAKGEIEVSRSHESLSVPRLGISPLVQSSTHSPIVEESLTVISAKQPALDEEKCCSNDDVSQGAKACDSGFESNTSRNPSDSASVLGRVQIEVKLQRSQSARADPSAAKHIRQKYVKTDDQLRHYGFESSQGNSTLPKSPLTSARSNLTSTSSKLPIRKTVSPMPLGNGGDQEEEEPPEMYRKSVEEIVKERKLSTPRVNRTPSLKKDVHPESLEDSAQSKGVVLVSPRSSKTLRRSSDTLPSPTSDQPTKNLSILTSKSSSTLARRTSSSSDNFLLEQEGSDGDQGRNTVQSMTIQSSTSMNFSIASAALSSSRLNEGKELTNYQEPVRIRKRSGNNVEKPVRASIAVEHPSKSFSYYDLGGASALTPYNDQMSSSSAMTITEEPEFESSDDEEKTKADNTKLSSVPELAVQSPTVWSQTVSKKTLKKLGRAERDRQSLMFEIIQTERNHLRDLNLLDIGFRKGMKDKVGLSDMQLFSIFPALDNLIQISKQFVGELMVRQEESDDKVIDSIADIVCRQFSDVRGDKMARTFGTYCAHHTFIIEQFKEHMKTKKFRRFVHECYKETAMQRREFPDLVQGVTGRISKYSLLMGNLVKESTKCKATDLKALTAAKSAVDRIVQKVDDIVKEKASQMELESIQNKLDIHIPKSVVKDDKFRKQLKGIRFTAKHRKMLRNGRAIWLGSHQRQQEIFLVLVTDFVAFLVEQNGKYNIAFLQDYEPPVIRLVDLHVRVDAASKVQLLLMTKARPEFFRLKFKNMIECQRWESTLLESIDKCKNNQFQCETFGEDTSDSDETNLGEKSGVFPTDPKQKMIFEANLKLESARRLLEKARKDNKAVSVTRSGSFASVDGRSKFLSQGKGDNSSQKGFSGARSQATRKSAFQKSSRQPIPSEDVPLEYLSCMAGMAETIQSLLKLIEEQDDTIGRLREQTGNTQNLPTETSISSIVSESNLDWGQRKRFQTIDDDEKTNLRGLTMSVPAYGNNLKPTRLTAPARSTSGDIRPRSFHEDLSDDNKVT